MDTKDKARGCLMAGAAGDALGGGVEFWSRNRMLQVYGKRGITQFDLMDDDKALITDDTQMTLFTANGLLCALTRHAMGEPGPVAWIDGVAQAYIDWYDTQNEYGPSYSDSTDRKHHSWLFQEPELHSQRAPGGTCLSAISSLKAGTEASNNSKGCGGIMRMAPVALLAYAHESRGTRLFTREQLAETAGELARLTHKHPLGFLPAALLSDVVYRVMPLTADEAKARIADIVLDTNPLLDRIYPGEFKHQKGRLKQLTELAVALAKSNADDSDAISQLGEGWVGEEAWAISAYCAVRHTDNVADAIIAAVNHDGDSDSTGAITGNIMGAIYGYQHLVESNLLTPEGRKFEETVELSDVLLTIADDLCTPCPIGSGLPIDTPERLQWHRRYILSKK